MEMKKQAYWLTLCVGVSLLTGSALAQSQSVPYLPTGRDRVVGDANTNAKSQSRQLFKTGDLIGADVKDSQGEKVGDITELYLNPQTGGALAVIDIEGSRDAVMPLQGLTVRSPSSGLVNAEVTLKKTGADLKSGPTIGNNEWSRLDDASFTRQIYSHYDVQPPSAMGGSDTLEESSSSTSSSGLKHSPKETKPDKQQ